MKSNIITHDCLSFVALMFLLLTSPCTFADGDIEDAIIIPNGQTIIWTEADFNQGIKKIKRLVLQDNSTLIISDLPSKVSLELYELVAGRNTKILVKKNQTYPAKALSGDNHPFADRYHATFAPPGLNGFPGFAANELEILAGIKSIAGLTIEVQALKGQDGGDGGKGKKGQNASCSSSGGNGWPGGTGGNGGNGGNIGKVIIQWWPLKNQHSSSEGVALGTSNVSGLKLSLIPGKGGKSGHGGPGGDGGDGINCGLWKRGGGASGRAGLSGQAGADGIAEDALVKEFSYPQLMPLKMPEVTGTNDKERYNRVNSAVVELNKKINELKNLENQAVTYGESMKGNLIEAAVTIIKKKGADKIDPLIVHLADLKRKQQIVHEIHTSYLEEQKELNKPYQDFLQDFRQNYYDTESKSRERFTSLSTAASHSESVEELIKISNEITGIGRFEWNAYTTISTKFNIIIAKFNNAYAKYKEQMKNFEPFLVELKSTLQGPPEAIDKIEQMLSYTDDRYKKYVEKIEIFHKENLLKIEEIEKKEVSDYVRDSMQKQGHLNAAADFMDIAQKLGEKSLEIEKQKSPRMKLPYYLPRYEYMLEYLNYEKTCSNLDELRQSNSFLYSGCKVIDDDIKKARNYLDKTLLKLLNVDKFTFSRVKAPWMANELIKYNDAIAKGRLVEAIKLHDELLNKAEEEMAAASSTPAVGGGVR
ncbi:MAG: hypothetical protein HQK50_05590 [Oligoflexia bacterium]|nr:hypothetical protein [Oligoflexia bacterium]